MGPPEGAPGPWVTRISGWLNDCKSLDTTHKPNVFTRPVPSFFLFYGPGASKNLKKTKKNQKKGKKYKKRVKRYQDPSRQRVKQCGCSSESPSAALPPSGLLFSTAVIKNVLFTRFFVFFCPFLGFFWQFFGKNAKNMEKVQTIAPATKERASRAPFAGNFLYFFHILCNFSKNGPGSFPHFARRVFFEFSVAGRPPKIRRNRAERH